MKQCSYCGYGNKEGVFFCEDCGRRVDIFDPTVTLPTKKIDLDLSLDSLAARTTWGTARFETNTKVIFQVRDAKDPITVAPEKRIIIGRYDGFAARPDIDLAKFGAVEKGVSRVHAVIYRSDETLMLVDEGSSNGTHLNGQRLVPHEPRILRDGDELRLGKLVANVYFRRR